MSPKLEKEENILVMLIKLKTIIYLFNKIQ